MGVRITMMTITIILFNFFFLNNNFVLGGDKCGSELVAKLVKTCPIFDYDCSDTDISTYFNITSYEDCGRMCLTYEGPGNCSWWSYDLRTYICHLKSSCVEGVWRPGWISGPKGCPTMSTDSKIDICSSCGSCPCCIGVCFLGNCAGECIFSAKEDQSVDEACLYEAQSITNTSCSDDCSKGETSCQTCIEDSILNDCLQTPTSSCWGCLTAIQKAIVECYNPLKSWSEILTCIKDKIKNNVPDCVKCVCKIVCKIFPETCLICKLIIGN